MNKAEFIAAIAQKSGLTQKQSGIALNAMIDVITQTLKEGDKLQLTGFGTFEVRERAARKGHNPSTGEPMDIPASKAPAFKPGKSLKDAL
ncbi:MAG: HU family DNA-binding protein [Clostridia bacterium]|nr:HU family DNA-binding protein [Clostridia bacterium]